MADKPNPVVGGRRRATNSRKMRKGRMATQRKFRGGVGFFGDIKSKVGEFGSKAGEKATQLKGKLGEFGSNVKERVGEKLGDLREAAAKGAEKWRDADNAYDADYNSVELIKELNNLFNGAEFRALKKKEEAVQDETEFIALGATTVNFDFTKSQYYSPEAWDRMVDKLREFLRDHPFVPPAEENEFHKSFDNLQATHGARGLPYYDLSNLQLAISKMLEKAEAARQAERQAEAARSAASSGSNAYDKAVVTRDVGSAAFSIFSGGRRTRMKRSKSKRYTRRR
jgi:hypothetical protein